MASLVEDLNAMSREQSKISKEKEDAEKKFTEEKDKLRKTLNKEAKEHEKEVIRMKENAKCKF